MNNLDEFDKQIFVRHRDCYAQEHIIHYEMDLSENSQSGDGNMQASVYARTHVTVPCSMDCRRKSVSRVERQTGTKNSQTVSNPILSVPAKV